MKTTTAKPIVNHAILVNLPIKQEGTPVNRVTLVDITIPMDNRLSVLAKHAPRECMPPTNLSAPVPLVKPESIKHKIPTQFTNVIFVRREHPLMTRRKCAKHVFMVFINMKTRHRPSSANCAVQVKNIGMGILHVSTVQQVITKLQILNLKQSGKLF